MELRLPKKSEIVEQFNDLSKLMEKCKTVEDARSIENSYGLYIEIATKTGSCGDHCTLEKFDNVPAEEIEWFRVESYFNLDYIYFRTDGARTFFDIANDDEDWEVLEDVTLDTIDVRYSNYIDLFKKEVLD